MALNGHHSTSSYSLFPTFQRQVSVNGGIGQNGGASSLLVSHPSVSMREQDTSPIMAGSQSGNDNPYGLISCGQSGTKSRKPSTENDGCDGESSLQHLVSNILEDADSQDNFFSDGSSSSFNPLWSSLREELPEYFQSGMKTKQNHNFPLSYELSEALSKTQGSIRKDFEQFLQQPNDTFANEHWRFNLPNGVRDSYTQRSQKLPPGQPVFNSRSTSLAQKQHDKDGEIGLPKDSFPDLSDISRSETKMSDRCFNQYYDDHFNQSSAKPLSNEQYSHQEISQLVNSLQTFVAGEHDYLRRGDLPNMHRQTVAMHNDESMVEQCKSRASASSLSTYGLQTQRQPGCKCGTEQVERNEGENNQIFNYHAFQDPPGVSPQNTSYFEQPNPIFAFLNGHNHYQSKATMHKQNASNPIGSMDQFAKQHAKNVWTQVKNRPSIQEEKKRTLISGLSAGGVQARHPTITDMPGGDEKQCLPQNLYFDPTWNMRNVQFQRTDEDNNTAHAANAQQIMCPMNDNRKMSTATFNSSNFSSRVMQPYGGAAPGTDFGDLMSARESAAFNSVARGMVTCRGTIIYGGNASAMTTTVVKNQGHAMQRKFYLGECYEQWKCLEKEREKTQAILSMTFPGKKSAPVISNSIAKTPPNPTRVDHLIVKLTREQARVVSLLDCMVCWCNIPLHADIYAALKKQYTAICITQSTRKEEMTNMFKYQSPRAHFTEDRDDLLLATALKNLAATTRKLRTALWYALQMTLPKPDKKQEQHATREAPHMEEPLYM
ncbi:uncharacterized protein moto [Xyrichtys novacula]|nr:uncharacterized protein moto [Xyrichtys novacula]